MLFFKKRLPLLQENLRPHAIVFRNSHRRKISNRFSRYSGVHLGYKRQLNKVMNKIASHCYEEVDLVLFLIDRFKWQKEEENILKSLKNLNKPVVLVINKIDRLRDKTKLLAFIKNISEKYNFLSIVPISALKKDNLMELKSVIFNNLEIGPYHFGRLSNRVFR